MERFSRMVVHYPYIILTTVLVFSLICLITPLVTKKFPDFSDPQMGFEARGTILAQRFTAWQNLMESTRASGELVDNPLEYYRYIQSQQLNVNIKNSSLPIQDVNRKTQKGKHKQKGKKKGKRKQQNDKNHNQTNDETKDAKELLGLGNKHRVNNLADNKKNKDHSNDDNFFCNLPTSSYARVVIGADSKETNLWSMEGISAQCHIDGALRANTHFTSLCQTQVERSGADPKCCRSWSPANYVALLSNRSSCLEVTENDLDRVKMLLEQCAYYYHNRQLLPNCAEDANCQRQVPRECYVRNAAYYLLHFLLDVDFIPSHETDIENKQNSTLQSVMLFLPVAASSATLDFYKEIDTRHDDLIYGNIRVQGMQFGLKSTLFDRLLVSDSSLLLAGFVFVTLCIWAYTGSVILTITTIFAVVFSLGISYAMYTLVLRIRFFPFMNFLAIVVAIGIGADDAFIYCKIWNSNKRHGFSDGGLVGGDASTEILPLRFVWGIEPIDNGDYLDPSRKGTPEWDETFDITAPESQLWLEQFCQNLRSEPFYRNTMGPLLSNCFIESLRSWMQRRCLDPLDPHIDYSPCCESSKFPYEPSVLQQCAAEATAELHRTPSYLWIRSNAAGLKFVKEPPHLLATMGTNVTTKLTAKIKALVVEYDSSYAYTLSFASMNTFFNQVENWMQGQLQNAPRGMQRGWFVSRLEFFELQRTLYNGTIWAIGVSLILALIVLALVTLNPLISLYAIVTVGAAIIVTVAILILLGWKLNVLESVAVSTAIGLAVDFSLHYAVSFKTSITEARIDRVKIALQQMGGPTFMAAITTGAAGALMLPSHVMAYIQIGVFLLLVMTISWIYATLLMCPMLAVAGPSLHFAQFKYPRLKMCFKTGYENGGAEGVRRNNDDRTKKPYKSQGIVSESTQGTSGTVRQPYCTELEMLTVRPPSPSSPLSALIG
ncbi:PREDICTED: protein dispatched isoform X2 [Dinoponera quadriceps]|uniref:Protein dispatched isoform X2 n=1 Tax=Dinoponera quadriceps TaxID=609295 RepID=A0A6P3XBP5_DINQU|nr:PREDICTED: protein dispatched isoform X2 [Dinoponera quadriceps]